MELFKRRTPSPAMVVALLALFVALGSGAYAALKLKPNSVKSKNIAPNAVKSPDIAPDAATGADVNEATLAKVPDADKLDGTDSKELPKVFSGSSPIDPAAPDSAVMFSVPQLGVTALADNTTASSGGLRIRNDRTSGNVAVSDHNDFDGVSFNLTPGQTSHAGAPGGGGFQNQDMPVTVTSPAVPGVTLTILCGIGLNGENCTGLLAGG